MITFIQFSVVPRNVLHLYSDKMNKILILILVYSCSTQTFNVDHYLDFWCKEPLKVIDFQPLQTDEYYRKEAMYKCGIWLRHVPNKKWTNSLTRLLQESSLPNLYILKISDGVEDIEEKFFHLRLKLRFLDLSGNHLDTLPLSEVKSESGFTTVLDNLQVLDLSQNNFTNISFIHTNAGLMQDLDLSENQLRKVPVSSLKSFPHLLKLIVRKNNITKFEEGSWTFPSLEHLDISYNQLKDLNGLENFVNLRILHLTNNVFPIITSVLFKIEIWTLKELYLDNCGIEQIHSDAFNKFPNLQKLKISQNKITRLNPLVFVSLNMLESLDISHNSLTELEEFIFISQKKLYKLNFKSNRIENLNYVSIVSRLPCLKEINVLDNSFYCEDFYKMLMFFEEKSIDVIGEEFCSFDEDNSEKCCKKSSTSSTTSTESYQSAERIYRKITTDKIQSLQWVINRTSYNISEYMLLMEKKSDTFFKLVLYQFAFIVIMSSTFFVVYTCRCCRRKTSSIQENKVVVEKIV